jgi:putative oxidoreductase
MNLVHKIETWGNKHHPVVLDPIRIALGVFLLFKGISFMNNTYTIHSILVNQNSMGLSDSTLMFFVYMVAFFHLVGGIMITLGVLTRIAALVQIPIMIAAVIMSNSVQLPVNTETSIAIVVLILLAVFSVIGSGKLSIEKVMENQNTIFS